MSLSLTPGPVTKYPSCLRDEYRINGESSLFIKFNATHFCVLGVETTWPCFEGTDVPALGGPTEVAPIPPVVHTGKQGGKTKGGAGVVSTK